MTDIWKPIDQRGFMKGLLRVFLGAAGSALPSDLNTTTDGKLTINSQTVTISGSPSGGTFTLSYDDETTAGIDYNAAASDVQSALVALTGIGAGGVSVSGSAGGPYTVAFTGSKRYDHVPKLRANAAGLTGSSTAAVTVTQPWVEVGNKKDGVSIQILQESEDIEIDEHRGPVDYDIAAEGATITFNGALGTLDKINMALNGTTYGQTAAGASQVGVETLTFGDGTAKAWQQLLAYGHNGLGYYYLAHFYKVAPNPKGQMGREFKKRGLILVPHKYVAYADMSRDPGDTIFKLYNCTALPTG